RGEPLATVCGVRQRARVAVAPRLSAEESEQARTVGVIEQQEVDLVGVLVLHDAPGEGAGVEEIRVQPDLAGSGGRRRPALDVDRDLRRDDAPVECARCERRADLGALCDRAAVELVPTSCGGGWSADAQAAGD